ncbi:hypothetical protein ACB094_05G071700 [Castanea mollissima]
MMVFNMAKEDESIVGGRFIYSVDIDGKIKAWLGDRLRRLLNCRTWGQFRKTMAFSADGKRRTIIPLRQVVPFDTMKNQFLATGDNSYLLTTTAAEAAPCIRFNKEGIQFAVSTSENGIKILANADCVRLLRSIENQAVDTSRVAPATIAKPQA